MNARVKPSGPLTRTLGAGHSVWADRKAVAGMTAVFGAIVSLVIRPRRLKLILLAPLLIPPPQVAAGQQEEIKKALAGCVALDNETARLDCFERLARAVAQIPLTPLEPRVSKPEGSARDVPTVSPLEAAKHVGEDVVVEGVVSDVGHSARSDTTFIRMGGRYPNHTFAAVIARTAKALFPEASSWEGKKARIRGVVQEYRGRPSILLERRERWTC